ncbi:hypothetical protein M8997_004255 [Phyllobacterium sp. 21LDTY02-6]|uniref:hypothetical protein n=1 Tax=Phyllobacterium sp. 21LDTY02-6 TaxID=2944903 RepID=UPI00202093A5|nr:hypothetical protein [Phyllobacterium sp. 21LDTY02-6]MCO4316384.1 hypothetical protein [Phyllobacterium sp. 21LDTY02-6]
MEATLYSHVFFAGRRGASGSDSNRTSARYRTSAAPDGILAGPTLAEIPPKDGSINVKEFTLLPKSAIRSPVLALNSPAIRSARSVDATAMAWSQKDVLPC